VQVKKKIACKRKGLTGVLHSCLVDDLDRVI
jgi:hypothetical protein